MNKTVGVIALIVALVASFYSGFLYSGVSGGDIDDRIVEVMLELEENHISQPNRELLVRGAIDGMIAALDDPFTTYFSAADQAEYNEGFEESYVGIGVTVSYVNDVIVIDQVSNGGPADQAGILPNDIIAFIDGQDVRDQGFYETIGMVVGQAGTNVEIGVIRQGVDLPIYFDIKREVIDNPSIIYQVLENETSSVGYINVATFGSNTASLFHDAVLALEEQNVDGLVIDLRDNGGGYLSAVYSMLDEFLVDNGQPMFSTEYYVNGQYAREEYMAENTERKPYEIVTLINEYSASASEVFASAMQEHGDYTVLGQTSYGKGTMQTDVDLKATLGDSIHLTIGKWFTSNEGWVHYDGGLDGVTPDVLVEQDDLMTAYKVFLTSDDPIEFDTVDSRLINIQTILGGMGYPVRTDGYFDTQTRDALEQIQTNNNLPVTGEINEDTLAVINQFLTDYKEILTNDKQLMEAVDLFE